jgi:CO dehydrogenase/acetyl-CoA synthase gamma subunit (corrinoid Fe-S protein)
MEKVLLTRENVAKLVSLLETTKLECRDMDKVIIIKSLAAKVKSEIPAPDTGTSNKFTQKQLF